jgi:hypothetical protein
MGRWCYCSKVLSGKTDQIRAHWKNKSTQRDVYNQENEDKFWKHLTMTGFDSWLQSTTNGDFIIHCLEGDSLGQIFKGLREQIAADNPIALNLQNFYLTVLGKDYRLPDVEPHIEGLLDISLSTSTDYIKRAFLYPLLPHKEEEHRHFRQQARGEKRGRHEAMMRTFGVSHLSTWLQATSHGKYIVVYTERHVNTPQSLTSRLKQGHDSAEWREVAAVLSSHTGLRIDELSPDVEWLTQPQTYEYA